MVEILSRLSRNVSVVDYAELIVSPKHVRHVKNYLSCSGIGVQVVSDDLQRQIDHENVVKNVAKARTLDGEVEQGLSSNKENRK